MRFEVQVWQHDTDEELVYTTDFIEDAMQWANSHASLGELRFSDLKLGLSFALVEGGKLR